MTDSPPALTLQRPWGWAIIWAGKDVENRTWPTRYRGSLFIHQGKGLDKAALQFAPLRHMVGEIGDHRVDEQARIRRLACRARDRGASAVEYGLLVAAVSAVIVGVVFALGTIVQGAFQHTCDTIASSPAGGGGNCPPANAPPPVAP